MSCGSSVGLPPSGRIGALRGQHGMMGVIIRRTASAVVHDEKEVAGMGIFSMLHRDTRHGAQPVRR